MFLDNNKIFNKNYLPTRNLVIISDGEYGFHVYFQHGYEDIEFSFLTNSDNLVEIINEINDKIKLLKS